MKRSVKLIIFIFVALVVVAAGWSFPQSVYAQVDTILSVLPEQSAVPLGNDIVLELSVYAGSEINAFDVTVQYDPGIITLTEWQHGDYLSNLTVVDIQNDPGTLRLAATQLATPAVSGNGTLLVMTFNVIGIGQSQVEIINAVFADSDGNSTVPVLIDGFVSGVDSSTYTPTPSVTLTATPTQTSTPSPTASVTPDPNLTATEALTSTPTEPAIETEPVPEGQEPLESATPTETPQGAGTPEVQEGDAGDGSAGEEKPGQESEGPLVDGEDEEGADWEDTDAGQESSTTPSDADDRIGLLGIFLWAAVIASGIAIIVMILIIIKRKRKKEEGLLL